MSDENQLTPVERELELNLAGLQPAGHGIQEEIVFFRAGQSMALRRLRYWQAVSSVILVFILGLWLWQMPARRLSEPLVAQDDRDWPPETAPSRARPRPPELPLQALATGDYLRLRTEVITKGLKVLPSPSLTPTLGHSVAAVSDWRLFVAFTPPAPSPLAN